ncbi:HAD-IIB family hydrolase [Companilactobacillus kimchii]|uniref:Hydrolase of the had superfamily n=2 Tax=Companilactobacillus kimchii TaxID=2801452 RepID=A0ABR5NRT6_9LACO|nr:HAD-IIB family hydrolase [Companilactobacillus kimchii]KAE9559370.1 hypothetical protein ATN91_12070 [Companilactobacillus kimchii]KRK50765.1 hydrolase of the had superfamily [Companilactobacillus kimchii DSM 13961 = JCM 10707]OWF32523.1 hypothetical protein LKACC12383_02044 [Companilactobacillus kimchii]GEO47476.1 hydrolase [Companilactobacillus paralimentarius]
MKYIFDVDGTLSFDGETIAPVINSAIDDLIAAGNEVIFASARPIRDLLPMIPTFTNQKLIGANGAMISIDQKVRVISKIDLEYYDFLKELINEFQLDYIVDGSWNYSSRITQESFIEKMIDPQNLAKQIALKEIVEPIKAIFVNLDDSLQEKLMTLIREKTTLNAIGLAGEGTVDITSQNINKAYTLDYLQVDKFIAFGNDRNDLEMLGEAQQSVWINSKPSLLNFGKKADVICEADSEKVAQLIKSFV